MKHKHFYSYLVETTHITIELGDLDLSQKERVHLLSLIDANIHSSVIKEVLENLDGEDKKIFLKNLVSNNHETVWLHLKLKIKGAESLVKKTIEETIGEMRKDIKNSRNQDK